MPATAEGGYSGLSCWGLEQAGSRLSTTTTLDCTGCLPVWYGGQGSLRRCEGGCGQQERCGTPGGWAEGQWRVSLDWSALSSVRREVLPAAQASGSGLGPCLPWGPVKPT